LYIIGSTLVSHAGFCDSQSAEPIQIAGTPNESILRPMELRGHVPKIDVATGLTASAAIHLRQRFLFNVPSERIGIVVGTSTGNHHIAKQYADKIRKGSSSPALFSTSGYSMCAGLAAFAAKMNGPSLVVPGESKQWADLLSIASNLIRRNDADYILTAVVEVSETEQEGICSMVILSKSVLEPCLKIEVNHLSQALPSENHCIHESLECIQLLNQPNMQQGSQVFRSRFGHQILLKW
jgi:hypothetical protein